MRVAEGAKLPAATVSTFSVVQKMRPQSHRSILMHSFAEFASLSAGSAANCLASATSGMLYAAPESGCRGRELDAPRHS